MGPIDYSTQVQAPFQAAAQGYQFGAAMRNDQQAQADRLQAQALEQQKQQQAMAAAQAQQAAIQRLVSNPNPTAQDFAAATIAVPGMREQFKQAHEMRGAEQAKSDLGHVSQVYAALSQNKPDIAIGLMTDRAAALRNSGREEDAKHLDVMANVAKQSPGMARTMAGLYLSSVPGGDKVIEGVTKLGGEQRAADKAPIDLRAAEADATTKEATAAVAPVVAQAGADKAVADAKTAAVTARFAEPQAIIDLQKKGWDIEAIKSDMVYKKEANRIATMNAVVAREGNALKAEELRMKIREDQRKLDETIRTNAANAESGAASIDNMLNTVERLKKNKGLNDVIGSVEGAAYYPTQAAAAVNALNPLTSSGDDRADAIALIETLGSQTFMAQIPSMKGTGALSEKEGDKLQSSLQNLSRKQSEAQFRANLDEAARLMKLARENISKKTGVPLKPVDTPAAPGSRPPISSFYVPGQ